MEEMLEVIKLNTIQKREKLNEVFSADYKGNGGAYHRYLVATVSTNEEVEGGSEPSVFEIQFQNGGRNTEGSIDGVLDTDLLEIVRHRLQSFQAGPYSSKENEHALIHIEEALMWLNRRVEDRIERNVLGLNQK